MNLSVGLLALGDEIVKSNILHELGHAHLLGHARCNVDIAPQPISCSKPLMNPDATTLGDIIRLV